MRLAGKTSQGSKWLKIILVLVVLVVLVRAWAWSGAGHMVIAAEAWHELSPGVRAKVTELLKSHPDYPKWESAFSPASPNLDLNIYIFMRASTWPDEIRRHGSQYDHPQWHYVDYPLKPPSFPVEPGLSPNDDILYGIAQCEKILADANAPAQERAIYLSWLIHLIGDIHQPLHCASLVNETYPVGDKGGNDFYLKPGSRGIKLHALWDGLLGTSSKPQSRLNYALEIQSERPRKTLPELKAADQRYLDAAQGWLGLGDWREANEELEQITAALRAHPDVLRVRYDVYAAAKKWEMAAEIAQALCILVPNNPFGCVHLAFSLHEIRRTKEAWDVSAASTTVSSMKMLPIRPSSSVMFLAIL